MVNGDMIYRLSQIDFIHFLSIDQLLHHRPHWASVNSLCTACHCTQLPHRANTSDPVHSGDSGEVTKLHHRSDDPENTNCCNILTYWWLISTSICQMTDGTSGSVARQLLRLPSSSSTTTRALHFVLRLSHASGFMMMWELFPFAQMSYIPCHVCSAHQEVSKTPVPPRAWICPHQEGTGKKGKEKQFYCFIRSQPYVGSVLFLFSFLFYKSCLRKRNL